MNAEGTTTVMATEEWAPMLKPSARLKVENKLTRLAHMLHRANDEHYRSVGWAELRGGFAFGLWLVGAWPTIMAPDHESETRDEGEFQRLVHEYHERYDPEKDTDPEPMYEYELADEDDDE